MSAPTVSFHPRPAFDALMQRMDVNPVTKDGVAWQAKSVETLFGDESPIGPFCTAI